MIDQLLQNSEDRIDIEVLVAGVKTDPDGNTATVTVTNPNGTVIYNDSAATRLSVGRYYFTVSEANTGVLGTYTAVWSFTIDGSDFTHTQDFEVVAGSISTAYLLPEEYRQMTNLDVSEKTDTQLRFYIKRASMLVDRYLGGSVRQQTYTEDVRAVLNKRSNGLHIQLTHVPVQSVSTLGMRYSDNNTDLVDMDTDYLRLDSKAGFIEYSSFSDGLRVCLRNYGEGIVKPVVRVSYVAGYSNIPEEIEYATARLTDQLINLETKEFKALQSLSASGYNESYRDSKGQLDIGKIGGDEVMELLKGYKQMTPANMYII